MSDAGVPHLAPEAFTDRARDVADVLTRYWKSLESRPVTPDVKPGDVLRDLPASPPESPSPDDDSWSGVLDDVERLILPALTHWQSPNFFAYFPANASAPAMLAELLSAGLGVQGMLWATSPACTELEIRMMDWLAEAIGLPDRFRFDRPGSVGGGVIQGTASESTLTALVAARARIIRSFTENSTGVPDDLESRLTVYTSTQAHSSVIKAAMVAGVARHADDRRRIRLIETDERCRLRPDRLREAMLADSKAGLIPAFVSATVGTTATTAIDPIAQIADAIKSVAAIASMDDTSFAMPWLHVDAAHAGAACVCPEYRHLLHGIDRADSLCFNPHKWLLTNFDCDAFWVADRRTLTDALSITPEYLRNAASEAGTIEFRDWHVPLGRRFRSLKLWFVMRHYGLDGLRQHIREHIRLAQHFESLLRADNRFEIVQERTLNLVCFRLRGEGAESDAANKRLLDAINATRRIFLTHAVLPNEARPAAGRLFLRMCIASPATHESHVNDAWDLIRSLV